MQLKIDLLIKNILRQIDVSELIYSKTINIIELSKELLSKRVSELY